MSVVDLWRVIEETQLTYHRLRQQYGGMHAEEFRQLTQLGTENARVKKPLAEAEQEKEMLKHLGEGYFRARNLLLEPVRFCGSFTVHQSGWCAE
jgi:hypothetical protein